LFGYLSGILKARQTTIYGIMVINLINGVEVRKIDSNGRLVLPLDWIKE